nr:Rieske 2Fe-2S domain-containing protein [Mesorhizobium sp.]
MQDRRHPGDGQPDRSILRPRSPCLPQRRPYPRRRQCLPAFRWPLDCKDGKLVCQWHGASFDMASGERIEGPASKGSRLMFLSTRVEDGALNYVWGE